MNENRQIPAHIGFIMDGNGRWAKKRLLPRKAGHKEGVNALKRVIRACREAGVRAVSFFAFSTENWSRPQDEIDALFQMVLRFTRNELPKYVKENTIVRFMGDLSRLPEEIQSAVREIDAACAQNTGMVVNIGLNYGGRDEIADAARKLAEKGMPITVESIGMNLYTADLPELDIVVRSSGEKRLSNFMLWQSAYAELIFLEQLWPDFDEKSVDRILEEYAKRDRRFGKVGKNA